MKKRPAPGAHARARVLRRNMTDAERRIWQILRSEQMQGRRFRRQVPIGRYIADFVCHKARLVSLSAVAMIPSPVPFPRCFPTWTAGSIRFNRWSA